MFDNSSILSFWMDKWFLEGREEAEDKYSSQPVMPKIDENNQKINEIVWKDWCLSIQMMGDMMNIDRETIRKILHGDLKWRKFVPKWYQKTLHTSKNRTGKTSTLTSRRIHNWSWIDRQSHCMWRDMFKHDPETKCQSRYWKTPISPRSTKAQMSKLKLKVCSVFSILRCYHDWVFASGPNNKPEYYIEVLTKLRESARKKRMWNNNLWILHQDNTLSVKQFLVDKYITVLKHLLY